MAASKKVSKNRNQKCIYKDCKQKAIGSYSVDIDVKPFYYCKKHKSDVSSSLLWALIGIIELSNAALGFSDKKKKQPLSQIS